MSQEKVTRLPIKRVIISLLLFVIMAVSWRVIDIYIKQIYISKMISINIFGSLLMIYNWPLLALHYERIKDNNDKYLFFVIGLIFFAVITWLASSFFNAETLIPESIVLISYGYARWGMIIAFSIIKAFVINISFKCLTDQLDIKHKELQVILVSSIVFGFVLTIAFSEFNIINLFQTYFYNILLVAFLSYSYNQTSSLLPGTFALSIVHFIIMLISIL